MPTDDPVAVEAANWIVRINSGDATDADRAALAAWRKADRRHDAAYRELEALWRRMGRLEQDPVTGLARVATKRKKPKKPLLLMALLGLIVFLAVWNTSGDRPDFATGTAEVRTITLPDGSTATLNAKSAINLRFTADVRRIEVLRGQVYFEVAADPVRPFVAGSGGVTATALGTEFEVSRRASGDVAVSVFEHAVSVVASFKDGDVVRLRQSQQVIVHDGVLGAVTSVPPDAIGSWRRGELIAEGVRLGDVVDQLRAYHPGLIMAVGGIDTIQVNAVLNLREPARSVDTLAAGLQLRVRHVSPYLTVITPH